LYSCTDKSGSGVATVVGNLAADFAYGILDPRIRYGDA